MKCAGCRLILTTLSAPAEKQDRTNEEEEEDEFDSELKHPVIKTVQKVIEVAEQLKDFAKFNSQEENFCLP